ncbi:NEW3 domain-containing protein [Streptomyces sp. NPDC088794]|uniref:NEW3 domain-containing protein n=1 Tax=Streptomyces sp. NPDC088794 TaxID=3365902 RepID=UPI0038160D3E
MRVTAAESTELFVGTAEHPHQVVVAEIEDVPGRTVLCTVEGPGVTGDGVAATGEGGRVRVEIPVSVDGLAPGDRGDVTLTVVSGDQVARHAVEFTAAETWNVADEPAPTELPHRTFDPPLAPRGNPPPALSLSPGALTTSGGPVTATVRVSSELTGAPVSGIVTVGVPPGWHAEPARLPYALDPGGRTLAEVKVTPPPSPAPGRHWLTAHLSHQGQDYEDVVALDVPGERHAAPTLLVYLGVDRVSVRAGERVRVPVILRNTTRGPVEGTLWAVSAWGTWPGGGPGQQGFTVGGGERLEVFVDVDGGAVAPGSYWLSAKAAWHGRVACTEAVDLEVTP